MPVSNLPQTLYARYLQFRESELQRTRAENDLRERDSHQRKMEAMKMNLDTLRTQAEVAEKEQQSRHREAEMAGKLAAWQGGQAPAFEAEDMSGAAMYGYRQGLVDIQKQRQMVETFKMKEGARGQRQIGVAEVKHGQTLEQIKTRGEMAIEKAREIETIRVGGQEQRLKTKLEHDKEYYAMKQQGRHKEAEELQKNRVFLQKSKHQQEDRMADFNANLKKWLQKQGQLDDLEFLKAKDKLATKMVETKRLSGIEAAEEMDKIEVAKEKRDYKAKRKHQWWEYNHIELDKLAKKHANELALITAKATAGKPVDPKDLTSFLSTLQKQANKNVERHSTKNVAGQIMGLNAEGREWQRIADAVTIAISEVERNPTQETIDAMMAQFFNPSTQLGTQVLFAMREFDEIAAFMSRFSPAGQASIAPATGTPAGGGTTEAEAPVTPRGTPAAGVSAEVFEGL